MELSLAWLLRPLAVQTFLDEVWGATHWHVKRDSAAYFDDLLSGPSADEELLQCFRHYPSAVRLTRGKDRKDHHFFELADGSVDLVRVRNDFADGFTIVLDRLEQYVRTVALLAHSIEGELNFATQVNGYITPPGSQGFAPHHDDHDVLILQIQGSKIWHLYDDAAVPSQKSGPRKSVDKAGLISPTDLCMDAGDVLYLPRGRVHAAEAGPAPSVHLTVGIHAPSAFLLIIRALEALGGRDDRVHARLPPRHLDDIELRTSLNARVRDILKAVEDDDVIAEGLDALAEVLVRRGRCPPLGEATSKIAGIDGQTRVAKYQPLYSRVTTTAEGGVALQFAKLSISASADHKAALLFASTSTEPFRVGDLPGLGAVQQTELARSLIVSGFLIRLPDGG